jgi:uncharacterized protein
MRVCGSNLRIKSCYGHDDSSGLMSEDSLLSFPCDFFVKVLGRNEGNFRSTAETIVQAHYVDLGREKIKEKVSKNGVFLSLTFAVYAQDKDEIDALYRDLVASEDVLLVL